MKNLLSKLCKKEKKQAQPICTLSPAECKIDGCGRDNFLWEIVDEGDEKLLKVTPNPEKTGELRLELSGFSFDKEAMRDVKFIAVNYFYFAPPGHRSAADRMILMASTDSGFLKNGIHCDSFDITFEKVWKKAAFRTDMQNAMSDDEGKAFESLSLLPFGRMCGTELMSGEEYALLGDIEFWNVNPHIEDIYSVGFSCKIVDAFDRNPERISGVGGTEYRLPKPTFHLEGAKFLGWRYSVDKKLYQPGKRMVMPYAHTSYNAEYEYERKVFESYFITSWEKEVCRNVELGRDNCTLEDIVLDEKYVTKIAVNTEGKDKQYPVIVDYWRIYPAIIELKYYSYMAVVYKAQGNIPEGSKMKLAFHGPFKEKNILDAENTVVVGDWAISTFEIDYKKLQPDFGGGLFQSFKLYPFGETPASELSGAEINICNFAFFTRKTELSLHEAYMFGNGGLFRPDDKVSADETKKAAEILGCNKVEALSERGVTRAQFAKEVNKLICRPTGCDIMCESARAAFLDVPKSCKDHADVMAAGMTFVFGEGRWLGTTDRRIAVTGESHVDYAEGEKKLSEANALAEKRIEEIKNTPNPDINSFTGKVYYVSSSDGDDANDGLSPESAWKTTKKVDRMQPQLHYGDAVLFKRGDLWRATPVGGFFITCSASGVTYSSYGEGPKPKFYGSCENGADPSKWVLWDDTNNIWEYTTKIVDVGEVILNPDSEKPEWSHRAPVDLHEGKFYIRGTRHTEEYDMKKHMAYDLDYLHYAPFGDFRSRPGTIYMRCDRGNPGEVFDSIEFIGRGAGFNVAYNVKNVVIENIDLQFFGSGAQTGGTIDGMIVRNCIVAWMGGILHWYSGPDCDGMIRMGNGLGAYGACRNYIMDNNYIYQCYDAGASHQISSEPFNYRMDNIVYSNNVIDTCIYSIEHFLIEPCDGTGEREGIGLVMENNICRRAGYGFGLTRPNGISGVHLQGRAGSNKYLPGTYIIRNNIFTEAVDMMMNLRSVHERYQPIMENNTYIQIKDGRLGYFGFRGLLHYDGAAETTIANEVGETGAEVYWLPDSYSNIYRGKKY